MRWRWRRECACSTSGAGPDAMPSRSPDAASTSWASTTARSSCGWHATRPPPNNCAVTFEELDVRDLDRPGEFDATICLCQGGFGLLGGNDETAVFGRIAATLRPGGRLALSAFSAAFAIRHLESGEDYDPATGVLHELATVAEPRRRRREVRALDHLLHRPRARPPRRARRASTPSPCTASPLVRYRAQAPDARPPRAPAPRPPPLLTDNPRAFERGVRSRA